MAGIQYKSRFSPRIYAIVLILISLGGLAASGYLVVSHYRNFTDIGYQSFCAISRSLNCDTVSQSPYAVFLGAPLAVWGAVGYLFFLVLILFFRGDTKWLRGWAAFLALAALLSLISIGLAIVSALLIHSYCLMCIVTYGINFTLLLFSWLASRRFAEGTFLTKLKADLASVKEKSVKMLLTGAVFLLIIGSIALFYPKYWHFQDLSPTAHVAFGETEDGSPWIGAQQPRLTIVEFADYMCFQCGKMHSLLRQLVNQYPDRIRLVHRHFPLDHRVNPIIKEQVHPNTGIISLFAIVARQSGKFWQVNDLLFRDARKKRSFNFGEIAKEGGLDISNLSEMINDKSVIARLENDIRAGLKLGITATPSYLIDGKVYSGTIPEDILLRAIEGK